MTHELFWIAVTAGFAGAITALVFWMFVHWIIDRFF